MTEPVDMPEERRMVAQAQAGLRLDTFLASFSSVASRGRAQRALKSGKVSVNGHQVGEAEQGLRLALGAEVWVQWNRPGTSAARSRAHEQFRAAELNVIFEDAHILAVDKPAGLLTDAATSEQRRERDSVADLARAYVRPQQRSAIVVHRLDRDTSGVVLLAKSRSAAQDLLLQFRHHEPKRLYLVGVQGGPEASCGRWEDMVVWDKRALVQRVAHPRERDAKPAIADWSVLWRGKDFAFLEVSLVTGRRNQIRLQCQLRGHPLLGERLYLPQQAHAAMGPVLDRQALHAFLLQIRHPGTGAPIQFRSALPEELAALLPADFSARIEGRQP